MDNMTLNKRKEELKQLALNNYSNGGQIYRIINNGYLDHIIINITEDKTITNSTAIVKKGYLTGNEQFIDLFSELIHWFDTCFITLQHKEWHIHNILENNNPKFLLCKKYWGDNKHIPYYKKNMTKLFVKNFYHNIKYIYNDFKDFFSEINIDEKMSLDNNKDLDILFNFLNEIIWCNYKHSQFSFDYIFSNYKYRIKDFKNKYKTSSIMAETKIYENYLIHWSTLITGYRKNINTVKKIITQ